MIYKIILSFFLVALFLNPINIYAQNASVPVQSQNMLLALGIANSDAGKISGTVEIANNTSKSFVNASILIKLVAPGEKISEKINGQTITRTTEGQAIDYIRVNGISIQPGEKQSKNFQLQYPSTIPSGDYTLVVQIMDADSSFWGTTTKVLGLTGSGQFLTVNPERCRVTVNGKNYLYGEGPNINSNEIGVASCLVKNTTNSAINAAFDLTYAVNSVEASIDSTKKITGNPLSFQPNQEQLISFNLPKDLPPQVYQGMFQMVSNGEKVSINVPFRWIVTGAAATIKNLELDKSFYKQNEIAKLTVNISSSPDLSWRVVNPAQGTNLTNPKLEIKITDNQNRVCGQKTENLPADGTTWGISTFDIDIKKECLNPVVEAKVLSDEFSDPLAQMIVKSESTEADISAVGRTQRPLNKLPLWVWVILGLILVSIIGGLIYYFKFRRKQNPPGNTKPPPAASGAPASTVTATAILLLLGVGYLLSNPETRVFAGLPGFLVQAQQDMVKQPVNSTSAEVVNVTLGPGGGGREMQAHYQIWSNARDFSQNNTGGDSQITVAPDCSRLNITVSGSSGSANSCGNWGTGLPVMVFIDGQPTMVEGLSSPTQHEVWAPIPGQSGNNNFDILRFQHGSSNASATFSVTPSSAQRLGNHMLQIRVGASYAVRHTGPVEDYSTTFENNSNCGGSGPCYVLLQYPFSCAPPPACNDTCSSNQDCSKATDGCTECRPVAGGSNTPAKTYTINFDTLPNGTAVNDVTLIKDQYASQGAVFTSEGQPAIATKFTIGDAQSRPGEALSQPNFLVGNHPVYADSYNPIDMDIVSPESGVVDTAQSVSVQLISVGSAGLKVSAYGTNGEVIDSKTITGTGDGYGKDELITLAGPGIARVYFERINKAIPHEDGFGIDDVKISFGGSGMTCQPPVPPACNSSCSSNNDCSRNTEGCTQCVAGQCRIPPACNVACANNQQCAQASDGCTVCLPNNEGTGSLCSKPPACNVSCIRDDQCTGARDGCTSCLPSDTGTGSVCRQTPACNVACTKDSQCTGARDGCTSCLPGDTGTGNVCRPVAACNVACTKDSQCAGARDGCTVCMGGVCKPPPACGTACTTKADCANPRDGCSECLEGTCTDYNENMCKCDGIVADVSYPSNAFKFEAFGKVEGNDTKKAEIQDITFRLTKDNQVIAKSDPIKPQVVESSAAKMRFKAAWQTPPPPVSRDSVYRVFADVRCKPKKIVASAGELATASMIPVSDQAVTVEPAKKLPVPKGTQLLADAINQFSKLLGYGNDLISKEALAQFTNTSPAPTQAGNNLQLNTLNFIKMMDTDNCRFVMWKFDETLF